MAFVPVAKVGNSKTPMGPFHTIVPAPLVAAQKSSTVLGPMSMPIIFGKLSLDGGELHVDGRIDAIAFEDAPSSRGGLLSRLVGG